MRISAALAHELIEHARAEAPNECCGVGAIDDGSLRWYERAVNAAASPLRFEMDGRDLLRLTTRVDDEDHTLAIVHSHTRSPAYPSQTDVNFARHWPGAVWVIVGVAAPEPELRAFAIEGAAITELDVVVEGA